MATRITRTIALIPVLLIAALANAQTGDSLRSLYDQHRYFELRDAIKDQNAPPLYLGAVASAFNDTKRAEKYLNRVIKLEPASDDAYEAHGQLAYLYARLGRNREVVQQFDRMLAMRPNSPDVQNMRPLFAGFSRYPDQSLGKKHSTKVSGATVSKDGLTIPVSIHGKALHWGVDTGANISVISEAEAQMLGLSISDEKAKFNDNNGGSVMVRTTVVDRLSIGEVEVRNVPFTVIPDSQPPFNDMPPGTRAILGFTFLSALKAISWTSDGIFEIGFNSGPNENKQADIWFDELSPVTRVRFQNRDLDFVFDTGNGAETQLWSRFSTDYASLLKDHGTKSTRKVTQMGGSQERDIVSLPELELQVGGFDTVLKPAEVFSKPVGNDSRYGLLGMDLLAQARKVKVDFRSMTVRLLP
ncbi:MAG: aspartyl protease family protein [Terracidiphilus sp.]|jgi:tetratricopeptide (TPR) repeat protein